MDIDNIDIVECLKDNPMKMMVKVVTAYINWAAQTTTGLPYPNISIYNNDDIVVLKSIEDLPEESRKYIFEELDTIMEKNFFLNHDLLLQCNRENETQALALLFVSYYLNLTNKFIKIFHYVFNMGIHNAPIEIRSSNHFHFQMQILCTLCNEGRLEDIRIFVEYCAMLDNPLVELLGVDIPDGLFNMSDLEDLMPRTYKLKRNGLDTYPLVYAIKNKHFHVIKFLLKKNDSVYNVDNHGKTALHYAFEMNDISIIFLLLNSVANESETVNPHERYINTLNSEGNTALDYWISNPIRLEINDQGENITSILKRCGAETKGDLHIMNEIGELIIDSDEDRTDNEYLDALIAAEGYEVI